jgi:hypothetical protein
MATMSLDNTWMQAQDRARKAGRILGEVLEKRVQGERPVILVSLDVSLVTSTGRLLSLGPDSPRLMPDRLLRRRLHCNGSPLLPRFAPNTWRSRPSCELR